jgi:energy-coupling factor transporter transmembrane protein EcfT
MTDATQPPLLPQQAAPQQPAYATPPHQPGYPNAPQPWPAPEQQKPQRNILGLVGLGIAAVGFIFACIPGALIVGWVLLPIGFLLGLISVFFKGKAKWPGLTAIIVAVVGTIVGIIVFFSVVAAAFNDSFARTDTEISTGDDTSIVEEGSAEEPAEEPAAEVGTRENPAPLGSTIEGGEWTVVINSVTLGAHDQILAENSFNEAPDAGTEYILVNYTATYTGTDSEGQIPASVGVEYVTADGVTVNTLDKIVVAPGAIDSLSTLYSGASATGNVAIQVPTPADGVIAVRPGVIADKVFVAIR